MTVALHHGDCLQILPTIEAGSIDAIITDLPYGTTACKWDEIIPFAPMWEHVKRILKPRGVFVTTASQPFTSKLIMSNLDWFRYSWIWNKEISGNPFIAKFQPLKVHEDINVFSENRHIYNPQMTNGRKHRRGYGGKSGMWSETKMTIGEPTNEFYPKSIINFSSGGRASNEIEHPTQKPVALYEYLIKTYTNEGDTVLDFTMGSGTTGVGCVNTGRNFIGVEKELNYFEIAERRIKQAQAARQLELV